jgi:hypothetical protein
VGSSDPRFRRKGCDPLYSCHDERSHDHSSRNENSHDLCSCKNGTSAAKIKSVLENPTKNEMVLDNPCRRWFVDADDEMVLDNPVEEDISLDNTVNE